MGVEPFGDSDASRTQDASLEHECVENVSSVEIMKATEASEVTRLTCRCPCLTRSIIVHYRCRLPEVRHPDAIITRLFQPLSLMQQGLLLLRKQSVCQNLLYCLMVRLPASSQRLWRHNTPTLLQRMTRTHIFARWSGIPTAGCTGGREL